MVRGDCRRSKLREIDLGISEEKSLCRQAQIKSRQVYAGWLRQCVHRACVRALIACWRDKRPDRQPPRRADDVLYR
ncbi:hypothetical protein CF58_20125 [Escherichia coli]|nr:hypothetical protein CF58_20125 [Escherichia coli]AHM49149.1 hypothetical protein CF59_20100 [Escherichia coli]AHM53612.1 hypothetical protein CF60_19840 [Escherichia coli]